MITKIKSSLTATKARCDFQDVRPQYSISCTHIHPSSCVMALGLTQPLTDVSSKGRPARMTDLTAVSRLSRKRGSIDVSEPYGRPRCYRDSFTFLLVF
jgi:hypothetical protein